MSDTLEGFKAFANLEGATSAPRTKPPLPVCVFPLDVQVQQIGPHPFYFCPTYESAVMWAKDLDYPCIARVRASGNIQHYKSEEKASATSITRISETTILPKSTMGAYYGMWLFRRTCERGYISLAKTLRVEYDGNAELWHEYPWMLTNAFYGACMNGHLATAEWLCDTFDLGLRDKANCSLEKLMCIREKSDQAIAHFLSKRFHLTDDKK